MTQITPSEATKFLEEAAKYFETRDTKGEDSAYWANIYNAQNCRNIIELIQDLQAVINSRM